MIAWLAIGVLALAAFGFWRHGLALEAELERVESENAKLRLAVELAQRGERD